MKKNKTIFIFDYAIRFLLILIPTIAIIYLRTGAHSGSTEFDYFARKSMFYIVIISIVLSIILSIVLFFLKRKYPAEDGEAEKAVRDKFQTQLNDNKVKYIILFLLIVVISFAVYQIFSILK